MKVYGFQYLGVALACLVWAVQAYANPSDDYASEFPEENAALIAATVDFFETVETAQPQTRKPILGLALESLQTINADPDATVLTRMGPVRHLTGYRITWYPVDRLLGTVDFMGTWDGNTNLVCGYLTWDMTYPDAPVLDRVSANFVKLSALSGNEESVVHESLLEANCAHGDIDANYAFFSVGG